MSKHACAEMRDLLPRYAANQLNDNERTLVEQHLASCPNDCRTELREWQALSDALAEAEATIPFDTTAVQGLAAIHALLRQLPNAATPARPTIPTSKAQANGHSATGAQEITQWPPLVNVDDADTITPRLSIPTGPHSHERTRPLLAVASVAALLLLMVGLFYWFAPHLHPNGSVTGPTATAAAQPTVTATPTASPQPTAVPTRAPHLVTLFYDPLTTNKNGWPTQNGCSFGSDGYHVSDSNPNYMTYCIAPIGAQSDTVNISVQLKYTNADRDPTVIGFRIQNYQARATGYNFYMDPMGDCGAHDSSRGIFLFRTTCPSIRSGIGTVNTLAINQKGAHMDFYINDVLVGSANDSTLGSGEIALETEAYVNVVFSDFTLTKWE